MERQIRPSTKTAMLAAIREIQIKLPFEISDSALCDGRCNGCSKKLLNYIEGEVTHWQQSITNGEVPTFGDIQRLCRSAKKIEKALRKNTILSNIDQP